MNWLTRIRAGLFLVVVALLYAGQPVQAAEWARLQLGFQNVGRAGSVLPVLVTARELPQNMAVELRITAADPRGHLCIDSVSVGRTDAQGAVSLQGTCLVGRLDGSLQIDIVDAQSGASLLQTSVPVSERTPDAVAAATAGNAVPAVADRLQLLRQSAQCLLTVGQVAGMAQLEAEVQRSFGRSVGFAVLRLDQLADLPQVREGLDSVDLLLLTDRFDLTAEQSAAIRQWVLTGGQLLISSGATISQLLQSDLGQWLQPHFELAEQPVSIRELAALQNYVGGAVQLDTQRRTVPMSRMLSDQIQLIVRSLDGPLVARRALGGGTVTFVSVDLNQRPLNAWQSLDKLYMMLVYGAILKTDSPAVRRGARISSSGVSDLSTQLSSVYDAIPAAQRWSSWQVMALIAVLLVLVGPLDYLLVVHLLKTPHLTWLTFPLIVAGACGCVYWQASAMPAGLTQRQLHVLDVSETDGRQLLHTRSWASLSSGTTQRSDITADLRMPVATAVPVRAPWLHWQGRAEDVYGGMYRASGAGLGRELYARRPAADSGTTVLSGVPMLASGSQAFAWESLLEAPGHSVFESQLTVSGSGLLEGDLRSRFPVPISDWVIFFGARVYQPVAGASEAERQIAPGQVWNRRDEFVRASDLKAFLNGSRIVQSTKSTKSGLKGDSMQITTPYDVRGTDPLDILTMVSLYEIAGGNAYVGLHNDTLRRMELSDTIRSNYALLIGRSPDPLVTFRVDGAETAPTATQTIIRALLPVKRLQAAPAASLKPDTAAATPGDATPTAPVPGTAPAPAGPVLPGSPQDSAVPPAADSGTATSDAPGATSNASTPQ